jgi:hypothetical protein
VGFALQKIAWQFAPHTRKGGCFLEGILVNAHEICCQYDYRICGF